MLNRILKIDLLLVLAVTFFMVSCEKENLNELSTENFTNESKMNQKGPKGKKGHFVPKCFKPVFPIAINFPDGTSETVGDKDELKVTLKTWKEANPDATERPTIAKPYDVELKDGTIITIETAEDLAILKESCERPNGHKRPKCFKPVFPFTFNFSDGTSVTVSNKEEVKIALKAYKEVNPDATERPTIAKPYDVELKDGTIITIETAEDLAILKESCERPNGHKRPKCFKPVFPFTFNFSDGTSVTVNNKEEVKIALKTYKEANPDALERPIIALPYDVELRDSTIVTITSVEDLEALKESCKDATDGHRGAKCFKPVFPFTFNFSDGTSTTVADKDEAKAALKAYKAANPDAMERPTIALPHDVELKDGTIVTIESEEDLAALKEECRAQGGGRPNRGN